MIIVIIVCIDNNKVADFTLIMMMMLRSGFKNPRHGNFPVEGYPPPRGLHGREFSEKLAEKS